MNATVKAMKMAWDRALMGEGLMDGKGVPCFPVALSDNGVQMAKKTAKQFFRDLGIKQLFARYQTPEDNAWIESWFRILKYDWLRFKDYIRFSQLERMIENFIDVYNRLRYHGAIGYVTPHQKHSGQAEQVLLARSERRQWTSSNTRGAISSVRMRRGGFGRPSREPLPIKPGPFASLST
jgi:transposase InsO family protein